MKLFKRFGTRTKVMTGVVLALAAVAVVALPTTGHALLGGDRETKVYTAGQTTGFDHVQFNSFTNVPNVGDERQFLTGKVDGASTPYYTALSGAQNGDTIQMRVYIHNNADSGLNASGTGVAKNTRVKVVLPNGSTTTQTTQAFISADNATPQIIEDDMNVDGASNFALQYVPGSAAINGNHINTTLGDDLVGNGVTIGSNDLSGNYNGCFDFVTLVTFKVKVVTPSISVTKQVRMHGTTTWGNSVAAKSGDQVDFAISFKNTGASSEQNVVVGDRMPVGLTYVPNTTMYSDSSTGNQWAPVTNDGWMKGGLAMGNYAAGAASYIKFTAKVDDASKLQCGANRLTNFAFAEAQNVPNQQASAEVDVTKTCTTETTTTPSPTPTPTPTPTQTPAPTPTQATPSYSCDLLDATWDNATRTVKITTFNTTVAGGAAFKTADIDWAQNGVAVLNTNTPVGQTHQYSADAGNTITIRATAHFSTNGSNDVTATSVKCEKQVNFTPVATTTTATQLPNTGAGSVVSIFAAATVAGALLHRLFLGRRLARR